jgi:hypothetical protein
MTSDGFFDSLDWMVGFRTVAIPTKNLKSLRVIVNAIPHSAILEQTNQRGTMTTSKIHHESMFGSIPQAVAQEVHQALKFKALPKSILLYNGSGMVPNIKITNWDNHYLSMSFLYIKDGCLMVNYRASCACKNGEAPHSNTMARYYELANPAFPDNLICYIQHKYENLPGLYD